MLDNLIRVCVCVWARARARAHTHTHTHIYQADVSIFSVEHSRIKDRNYVKRRKS